MPDPAQVNRLLSTIRTELEYLRDAGVLQPPRLQSIRAQLPRRLNLSSSISPFSSYGSQLIFFPPNHSSPTVSPPPALTRPIIHLPSTSVNGATSPGPQPRGSFEEPKTPRMGQEHGGQVWERGYVLGGGDFRGGYGKRRDALEVTLKNIKRSGELKGEKRGNKKYFLMYHFQFLPNILTSKTALTIYHIFITSMYNSNIQKLISQRALASKGTGGFGLHNAIFGLHNAILPGLHNFIIASGSRPEAENPELGHG
ncbi:MAG: hypothetical protein Q9187_007109 [Circinaria calcarea]